METVHFTELKHLATRGQIRRGMRYMYCHDGRSQSHLSGRAHATEILTATQVVDYPDGMKHRGLTSLRYGVLMDTPRWGKRAIYWRYASDSGLWDLEVSYQNKVNYLLDIQALVNKGIVIDDTPLENSNHPNVIGSLYKDRFYRNIF